MTNDNKLGDAYSNLAAFENLRKACKEGKCIFSKICPANQYAQGDACLSCPGNSTSPLGTISVHGCVGDMLTATSSDDLDLLLVATIAGSVIALLLGAVVFCWRRTRADTFNASVDQPSAGTLVSTVDGLETLLSLSSLKLEENLPAATKWCRDEGVESVKDLMEEDYADRLAKALQLSQIESSKLITAIKSWGCAAV